MEKEKLDFIKANGKVFQLKVGELVRLETDTDHFYWLDGEYVPATTSILAEAAPTPYGLKKFWQTNTEEEANRIFETAGDFGSKIHDALEKLLNGLELNLLTDYPTIKEKVALLAFIDWFGKWKPKDYQSEQIVASKKYKYAGTLDFVGKIGKETWLIDWKTSNAIHFSHQLQVLAYKQAYEESIGTKIDKVGVLRVGSLHKGNGKETKELPFTGKNWELKEVTDYSIEDFTNIYKTYLTLHGGKIDEPKEIAVFPETLKLLEEVENEKS